MDYSLIDWELLETQKCDLLNLIDNQGIAFDQTTASLTGILHLLDYIQDSAVDAGVPEDMVFPQHKEE